MIQHFRCSASAAWPIVLILFVELSTQPASLSAQAPITHLSFAPSGRSLVACSQNGIEVFSWPELLKLRTITLNAPNLHHCAFSQDGKHLAVGGGDPGDSGTVEILSWPAGETQQTLKHHSDSVHSVAWLSDTALASASLDHDVVLWDTDHRRPISTLRGHSRAVTALAFLPTQGILISAGVDQSLRVWNRQSEKLIHSLSIHTLPVHDLAVRPGDDGLPMLASASDDRSIRLWQPTIGRMVRFARLSSKPLCVQWNPDGTRIVAACQDGRLRIIDPETVEVQETIAAIDGWAYALAVHPNDKTMAVGGSKGQLVRIELNQRIRD